MLFAGFAVAIIGGFVGWIFEIPALSLAISAIVIPLSAALISFETNNIVRGGETNYIMATVTLFVAIYNIFHSLLLLLGIFGSDDWFFCVLYLKSLALRDCRNPFWVAAFLF